MHLALLLLLLLHTSKTTTSSPPPSLPDRFITTSTPEIRATTPPQHCFEVTKPLPNNHLSPPPPCTQFLLHHDFANTYGEPAVSRHFSPPSSQCPAPWRGIAVELRVSCVGEQYDRIAGIWIDGVEILRTSTAEPTDSGVFWTVRKDISRYSSLFSRTNLTVTVMLENIVNDEFTGIYHVNLSLIYYPESEIRVDNVIGGRVSGELGEKEGKVEFLSEKSGSVMKREGELGFLSGLGFIGREKKLGVLSGERSPGMIRKGRKSGFSDEGFELGRKNRELGHQSEEYMKRQKELGVLYSESVVSGEAADLIIPISDDGAKGFWFEIKESDVRSKKIKIPVNTYRAVVEIYVSFHSNDEFWYSNPPNSYFEKNNLPKGRGNGAFREVFVTIDKLFAGSVVPFPVIFTGGLNPLYWQPVVGIGAFNLPSYDLELTPFLGNLLDGKTHSFGLGVTRGIAYWLVNANLHLWLDQDSARVKAKLVTYKAPNLSISCDPNFEKLNGSVKIEARRKINFSGWVQSSVGNLTTHVSHEYKFKNKIKFKMDGNYKDVEQKVKVEAEVRIVADPELVLSQTVYKYKYPIDFTTSTVPKGRDTYLSETEFSNSISAKSSVTLLGGQHSFSTTLSNAQDAHGSMLVHDHSVLSGAARTRQTYKYKDDNSCYYRTVVANDGNLLKDNASGVCVVAL